jgi:hypothetical protein
VSKDGGILLAPNQNPGFDVVGVLAARRRQERGIVLLLFETKYSCNSLLPSSRGGVPSNPISVNQMTDDCTATGLPSKCNSGPSDATTPAFDYSLTRKASFTLHGLKGALPYFRSLRKPVLHVCYVYVTTENDTVKFQTDTADTLLLKTQAGAQVGQEKMLLGETISALEGEGTTVSLHVVAGQRALEDFFTAAVYHVIPDPGPGLRV